MSYLAIQLRFTKLSPYFWWCHCAICTCVYLHFYFVVIYRDIFPCRTHAKDLFFSIKHSHFRCWRCLLWRTVFFFAKHFLVIVVTWIWGLLLHTFENCPTFSQVLQFLLTTGQNIIECGLPPHLVHILLLLLALNFLFGFRKVFLKVIPTSSFTVKGLIPEEEFAKAIDWLLNCEFLVISVIDIVGFALIPSSSLSAASGSLKPEINFVFTNSSSVLSFSKSQ